MIALLLLLGVTAGEWMEGEAHVASFGLHDVLYLQFAALLSQIHWYHYQQLVRLSPSLGCDSVFLLYRCQK